MKSNVCIVSLNNDFTKSVAQNFANATDMFFADIDELIKYELIDVVNTQELCGADYIKKVEHRNVKNASNYENTCVCINFDMLNDNNNYKNISDNCVIVMVDFGFDTYAKMKKPNATNGYQIKNDKFMFSTRKKILKEYADVVVRYLPNKDLNKSITKKLCEYYKKTTLK